MHDHGFIEAALLAVDAVLLECGYIEVTKADGGTSGGDQFLKPELAIASAL
jgi:hypothetical protein